MAKFTVSLMVSAESFEEAEEAEAAGTRSPDGVPLTDMPEIPELEEDIKQAIKSAVTGQGWVVEGEVLIQAVPAAP